MALLPVAVTIDPYVELRIDAPQNRSDSSTQEKYLGVKSLSDFGARHSANFTLQAATRRF
jgi:hypothetical protein